MEIRIRAKMVRVSKAILRYFRQRGETGNEIQSLIEFKQSVIHVLADLHGRLIVHLHRIEGANIRRLVDMERPAKHFSALTLAQRMLNAGFAGAGGK